MNSVTKKIFWNAKLKRIWSFLTTSKCFFPFYLFFETKYCKDSTFVNILPWILESNSHFPLGNGFHFNLKDIQVNWTLGVEGKSAGYPVALPWLVVQNNAKKITSESKDVLLLTKSRYSGKITPVLTGHSHVLPLWEENVWESRRKKLFKSNWKWVPQGSPWEMHGRWHPTALESSVSYKGMMLQREHCSRL